MSTEPEFGPSPDVVARRRQASERWARRSRSIQRWRKLLPIAIGVVFGALLLWLVGRGVVARLTTPKQTGDSVVKMTNPRFFGRDASDHAFVVAAQSAERRQSDTTSIILTGPSLSLEAQNSGSTRLQAARGVYEEKQRQVRLEGGVKLDNPQGYSFSTPRAVIDTQKGVVTGDQGVQGKAPLGQIAASSYGVYDRGRRVVFEGNVHARIEQPSAVQTTKPGARAPAQEKR
jgi:lipopolysaccharide export system protein LptC